MVRTVLELVVLFEKVSRGALLFFVLVRHHNRHFLDTPVEL